MYQNPYQSATIASKSSSSLYSSSSGTNASQICSQYNLDLTASSDLSKFNIEYCPQNVRAVDGLLALDITKECGTTLVYAPPFLRGRVDVVMKTAAGSGAVTALVLSGPPPSDEIDIEIVGVDPTHFQSMYYVRGQRIDQTAQFHSTASQSDLSSDFNTYSFEITDSAVNWYLNNALVRSLPNKHDSTFPGAVNNFRFGVWDGSNYAGWAGSIDWSLGTRTAYIRSISIAQYC